MNCRMAHRLTARVATRRGFSLALCSIVIALVGLVGCKNTREVGFPHAFHLKKVACGGPGLPECVVCFTCHNGLREAPERKQVLKTTCVAAGCHEKRSFKPGADIADDVSTAARAIRFTHNEHLKRKGMNSQCVGCHAGAISPNRPRYPSMGSCLKCHQAAFDDAKCAYCHEPHDLVGLLPRTFMRHDEAWVRRHGVEASSSPTICRQCHSEQSCKDCHDVTQSLGVEVRRPDALDSHFVHSGDFVTRHSIEARSESATCARCHAPATCDACHVRRGVSPNGFGAANPHPLDWVGPNPASPNFHGRAARRDLFSCASCHDQGQATNCIFCHKVGGPGGNPHPRGFTSARDRAGTMCRYCHGG